MARSKNGMKTAPIGAISVRDVEKCRKKIKIGDVFTVASSDWIYEIGMSARPVVRGRVTAKYPHLVTLDCGTSITYVQIVQYQRKRGRNKYVD